MSGPQLTPPVEVPPIPPAPDGALMVGVPCRTSGSGWSRHEVTITADWSLSVPHDLAGERIAAAFGGGASCLELVDRGLPAVIVAVCRHLRVGDAPIELRQQGDSLAWCPAGQRHGCCSSRGFETAADAATHARGPHVAAGFGVKSRTSVELLLHAVLQAHLGPVADASAEGFSWPAPAGIDAAGFGVVSEPTGMSALWDAGMHPDQVLAVHGRLGVRGPLPAISYLALTLLGVDLEWVARGLAVRDGQLSDPVLVRYDDRNLAPLDLAWLCPPRLQQGPLATWMALTCTPEDAAEDGLRAGWLTADVPRRLILELQAARYLPDQVIELGVGTARAPSAAALALYEWVRRGWHPQVADLIEVHRLGVAGLVAPSAAAVAELQRSLLRKDRKLGGGAGLVRAQTELALLVAAYGSARAAARAHRAGRGWRDAGAADLLTTADDGLANRVRRVGVSAPGQADASA